MTGQDGQFLGSAPEIKESAQLRPSMHYYVFMQNVSPLTHSCTSEETLPWTGRPSQVHRLRGALPLRRARAQPRIYGRAGRMGRSGCGRVDTWRPAMGWPRTSRPKGNTTLNAPQLTTRLLKNCSLQRATPHSTSNNAQIRPLRNCNQHYSVTPGARHRHTRNPKNLNQHDHENNQKIIIWLEEPPRKL